MASVKIVYSVARYWRCYFLLLVACLLTFVLIYIGQNDPNLEHYFPYFRGGSKYNYYFSDDNLAEINELMEKNYLDYEFLHSNSRFCLSPGDLSRHHKLNKGGGGNKQDDEIESMIYEELIDDSSQLDFILLSISQAHHFKYRSAARSTWAKYLNKLKAKLVFIIGDPFYQTTKSQVSNFSPSDKEKLIAEMREHGDMVQVNMADHENYTSTKSLIGIRWAFTYCMFAKNVFLVSDSAILNHKEFDKLIRNQDKMKLLDDRTLAGFCNYTDEKLAYVLKHFFSTKQPKLVTSSQIGAINRSSPGIKNNEYKGQFCSSIGWMLTMNGAKQLWMSSLRAPYMMKLSTAYLTGYLAYKANLKQVTLANYHDYVPTSLNCLEVFNQNPDYLLCAENFTLSSRYTSYIASWNSHDQSQLGIMIHL